MRILVLLIFLVGCSVIPTSDKQDYPEYTVFLPLVKGSTLENGNFEGGFWKQVRWWQWGDPNPRSEQFENVRVPEGWTGWWVNQRPCPGYTDYKSGKPEGVVISLRGGFPDPLRIKAGDKAFKWFTFYRCHLGGIYQQVTVQPGQYRFSAYAHLWYTNCSTRPHDPPYQSDCASRLYDKGEISIGIDPTGGEDYNSPNIVWSDPVEQYGVYGAPITLEVTVVGGRITLFIKSETTMPTKHEDLYVDEVTLDYIGE